MNALAPRLETETETLAAAIRAAGDHDHHRAPVRAVVVTYDAAGDPVDRIDVSLLTSSGS